jgi:prepilin-type N-terminal cleavage/methylation domain-containing protein
MLRHNYSSRSSCRSAAARSAAARSAVAVRNGFTLVEILCVVVILGIASAVIIPQLGTHDDLKVAAAARVVMADFIYAQNTAIAQQKRYYVQFAGQQYSVMTRPTDADPLAVVTHPVTKNAYTVTMGTAINGMDGVTIGTVSFGGSTILGFDDLGSPFALDAATNTMTPLIAAGTIPLTCGNQALTISIEPYTGETIVN